MKAVGEPKSSLHFETEKVQAAFSCAIWLRRVY
jgi:hypothetical protein